MPTCFEMTKLGGLIGAVHGWLAAVITENLNWLKFIDRTINDFYAHKSLFWECILRVVS